MKQELRSKLFENYDLHYARVNIRTDCLPPLNFAAFTAMYGRYLERLPKGSFVLDAGCGTGLLLQHIRNFTNVIPVGVDISAGQIASARKYVPDVEFFCEDAQSFMKSRSETYGGIFCMDVIEHLATKDDCCEFVRTIHDALLPGGFCIIRVPNAANFTGCYSRYMDLTHERSFTRTSLMQLMEAAGFVNLEVVPVRAAHISGKLRLAIEYILHKCLFRICGRGMETVFTYNIVVAGEKKDDK